MWLNALVESIIHERFCGPQLAAGNVNGAVQTRTKLDAVHCRYIGTGAKSVLKQFALAVEWLKEAKRLAKIGGTTKISNVQADLLDAEVSMSYSYGKDTTCWPRNTWSLCSGETFQVRHWNLCGNL